MPDYSVLTAIAVIAVVLIELAWLRTGIFSSVQYWITMAIVFAFQVLVDGWLTKLSDPIVIYNPDTMLGVRAPWDIPVEDFGFGFAMVTLAIMLWRRAAAPLAERQTTEQQTPDQALRQDSDSAQDVRRRLDGSNRSDAT